jgi:hypothetical protein
MQRSLIVVAMLFVFVACASFWPKPPALSGVVTIEAQTLPIARTVAWDANAASEAVTNYVVRLDGVVIGSPTGTTQAISITTLGVHVVAVRAVNVWGESVDATLTINVVAPSKPAGLRLQ